jgi:hypothetical protein
MPREARSGSAGPVTSAREATARTGVLGMGRIEATGLAHERSVLATDSAAAREHSHLCDSFTNWCLALVRGQDPARLPPASETLASPRQYGRSRGANARLPKCPKHERLVPRCRQLV